MLALRGETVLHASAVEVGGRAAAFVAHSGGGKSTLATLACAGGARLVTDDLLRTVVDEHGTVRYLPGPPETRLRRALADLVHEPGATRRSVDGWVVWCPEPTPYTAPVLAAVVLPELDDETAALRVTPVPPARAVMELTRRPRILGLRDPTLRTREFSDLARLIRAVPVHAAAVPWGPPFDTDMTTELLAMVGVPVSGRHAPTPAS